MTLLNLYIQYNLENTIGNMAWIKEKPIIDKNFTSSTFYRTNLGDFKKAYFDWLNEMAKNTRGFEPFRLTADLAQFIVGFEPKKSLNPFASKTDFPALDEALNEYCKSKPFSSAEDKFLQAMAKGSDIFLNKKFSGLFNNL